jgi:LPXTG-site transpeptidase (sortase) family protein
MWDVDNQPGLFADLKTLKYGDTVLIHAFGEIYTYEVRDTRLVSPLGLNKAIDHEYRPWMTLVTCEDFDSDSGNYIHRRLVSAVLLKVTSED